jgi:hypothetical protein
MKQYERIEVKNVPVDVAQRLNAKAKELGYKSRSAFLLDIFTKLSLEDIQFECENRYVNLMEELKQVLLINANVLKQNQQAIEENSNILERIMNKR